MSEEFLPESVREGLAAARAAAEARNSRLRLHADGAIYRVQRYWPGGFALALEGAPRLRGLVDLYDGARHVSQCLIVAATEEAGEMIYEFKRETAAADRPALDFVRDPSAPIAYLTR